MLGKNMIPLMHITCNSVVFLQFSDSVSMMCHATKLTSQEWRNSLDGSENDLEACVNIGCGKATLDLAASFLKYDPWRTEEF